MLDPLLTKESLYQYQAVVGPWTYMELTRTRNRGAVCLFLRCSRAIGSTIEWNRIAAVALAICHSRTTGWARWTPAAPLTPSAIHLRNKGNPVIHYYITLGYFNFLYHFLCGYYYHYLEPLIGVPSVAFLHRDALCHPDIGL